MRKVHLHGRLAAFGGPYNMEVSSVAEALRGLMLQIKGLGDALREGSYRVTIGGLKSGRAIDEAELRLLGDGAIHVMPVAEGAGKGGAKIVLGLAIVAAAFTFGAGAFIAAGDMGLAATAMSASAFSVGGFSVSFGSIAAFGAMMAIGGISGMLSPQANANSAASVADKPSYYFNGPVNVAEQGNCVPLVYGRVRVGSVVVSSGMKAEMA